MRTAVTRAMTHLRAVRTVPLAGWCVVPLVVWLVALAPGVMTNDSLVQWRQGVTGRYVSDHPPLFTFMLSISRLVVGGPLLLVMAQVLVLSLALAWCATGLRGAIGGGATFPCVALALAVSPSVGVFAVTVWKDVWFTACLLAVFGALVRCFQACGVEAQGAVEDVGGVVDVGRAGKAAGRRAVPTAARVWLVVGSVGAVLFRPNGVVTVGVALVFAAVWWRGARVVLLATTGLVVVVAVVTQAWLYSALGVADPPSWVPDAFLLHDLGAVAEHAHEPTVDRYLAHAGPIAVQRRVFTCRTIDPTTYHHGIDWGAAGITSAETHRLWLEQVGRHPALVVGNHLCAAELVWLPFQMSAGYVPTGIDANREGLHQYEAIPVMTRLAGGLARLSGHAPFHWVFWSMPAWFLVAVVAVVRTGRFRKDWRFVGLLALPLGLIVAYLVASVAQDFRYVVAGTAVCVFLAPLAVVGRREHPETV